MFLLYAHIAFCQVCKVVPEYLLLFCRQGQCRPPQPGSRLPGLPDGGQLAMPEQALSATMHTYCQQWYYSLKGRVVSFISRTTEMHAIMCQDDLIGVAKPVSIECTPLFMGASI